MRLENQVAVITGGAGGIGRETGLLFAAEGASCVLSDVDEEKGAAVVEEIKAAGGEAVFIRADVSKAADCEAMIRCAEETYGKLTCLFNNAGVMLGDDGDAESTSEDIWDLTMAINVKGVFFGCKYGIPAIKRAGGGTIINTASFVAHLGAATPQLAYTSSKGAVLAMTRELATIHARENIRVNAIAPGPFLTDMMTYVSADEALLAEFNAVVPMNRSGGEDDIKGAAVFLASDASAFVTGHTLVVDGGVMAVDPRPSRG